MDRCLHSAARHLTLILRFFLPHESQLPNSRANTFNCKSGIWRRHLGNLAAISSCHNVLGEHLSSCPNHFLTIVIRGRRKIGLLPLSVKLTLRANPLPPSLTSILYFSFKYSIERPAFSDCLLKWQF